MNNYVSIENMNYEQAMGINARHLKATDYNRVTKKIVEDNIILTREEKIKVLYNLRNRSYHNSVDIKDVTYGFHYSKMSQLKQSLYNVMYIKENDKKGLIVKSKVADYKNLILNSLAYIKHKKIEVKDSDYMINQTLTVEVLVLTPLAYHMYDSIKEKGQEVIDKEVNRLKRMGAI